PGSGVLMSKQRFQGSGFDGSEEGYRSQGRGYLCRVEDEFVCVCVCVCAYVCLCVSGPFSFLSFPSLFPSLSRSLYPSLFPSLSLFQSLSLFLSLSLFQSLSLF